MQSKIFLACKLTGIDWAFSIDANKGGSRLSVVFNTGGV